ncbi:MAG: carbohydrate kinase [Acholeplasma sp.]|nr:carbohydrate kinase [Acholeplasma sp.]
MKDIVCMGELLIDFIPNEKGVKLNEVSGFLKYPGGAPANVCVAAKASGVNSYFLGQVGKDSFGEYLIETLKHNHVNTDYIHQTTKAKTALAFVSLTKEGERDFIFYRDPSADQLYRSSQVPTTLLKNSIFHFCSVSLSDHPIKNAHEKAIKHTRDHQGFVSFDPNLRLSLWRDHEAYQQVIRMFIPKADLLKISEDEIEFITGENQLDKALNKLFVGHVQYVIITRGKNGSICYFKDGRSVAHKGFKVNVTDTTGAGDAFIGSFLAEMSKADLVFNELTVEHALKIANAKAALTTTKYGGMSAIPSLKEYETFVNQITNE